MTSTIQPAPLEIWRIADITRKTKFSRAWIYVLMNEGKFPKARKIGKRSVGWNSLEVQKWIDEQMEGTQ